MKRLFTVLALMLYTLLTFAQFSGSGQGTENDPYLILNPIHVNQMRNYLGKKGVYFKVMANIDMTDFIEDESPDEGWQPVGNSSSMFQGILDGNGKTIKGLWSKRSNSDYVGLFGYTDGATIKNLTLEASIIGRDRVGGFVGRADSKTTLNNCTFKGIVEGRDYVGGFMGYGYVVISNCKGFVEVNAIGGTVGGFVGLSESSTLNYVYVKGKIQGGSDDVGGLVGDGSSLKVTNSCFFGSVVGSLSNVGGLLGDGEYCDFIKSFAIADVDGYGDNVGGLVGCLSVGYGGFAGNYFNGSVSGKKNIGGLVGKVYGEKHASDQNSKLLYSYSKATILGDENVGGIVGSVAGQSYYSRAYYYHNYYLNSCVAVNTSIHATVQNVGRVYGTKGNYVTIGTQGTSSENRVWNRTLVMQTGGAIETLDGEQHGTGVSENTLKLKATYVGAGWTFDNENWAIQETECLPYMAWQTAPPVITSDLVANATTISGKCVDGGTVTLEIDGVKKQMVSSNHNWSFTVDPLKAGHEVRVSAEADGKVPSYYTVQAVSYAGKGTEADPYRVYTADDLRGVYRKGYYKLMNDIDLTQWINENSPVEGWEGVGREGNAMSQFDGNGFTISGLWSNSTRDNEGLFAMFSNGTIKNLTVTVASGKKVKGGNYTGILIGYNTNGTISDCTVMGDVEGTINVGGIMGYSINNELKNNVFIGSVKSVTGNALVGGIAGSSENDQIVGCYTEATLSASGSTPTIGGIAGKANSTISESMAKGAFTATGSSAQVGGIVGVNNANGVIQDCSSAATLNSTYSAAGIVSYNYGKVTRSFGSGDIYTKNFAAGIVGYNDGEKAVVNNCVASNNKIDIDYESQQESQGGGYGQRVVGGIKNGAPAPEMYNYALKTMQVSVNDVAQKVYDDIMNGTAKTADQLSVKSTYEELGWDFTSKWFMNSKTGFPDLKVNVEKTEQSLDLTSIPVMKYGDAAYQLPAKTNEGLDIVWTIGDSRIASVSGNTLTIKKAGSTTVSATQDGTKDYKAYNKSFELTVNKVPLTISAKSCSKNVGEENPALSVKYEGFVLNETETVLSTMPTIQTDATVDSPEGTYYIKVSGAEADNYDIKYVSGTLTVVNEIAIKNSLYTKNISGRSGTQFVLPVNMKNEDEITALQFELTLPAGVSIALNSKNKYVVEKTDRCPDHTLSASKSEGTTYTVLLYSPDVEQIDGNDGAVVNVRLEASSELEIGNYEIVMSNINLTRTDAVRIKPENVSCTLTIIKSLPGDANGDGDIDVTDIVAIANKILGKSSANFDETAADANGDGDIDVTDIVAIANMILHRGNQANAKMREIVGTPDPD